MPLVLPAIEMQFTEEAGGDWQRQTTSPFRGGLNTFDPESNIRDDQFTALVNLYIENDGSLRARGPYRPYDYGDESVVAYAPLNCFAFEISGADHMFNSNTDGADTLFQHWDGNAWQTVGTFSGNTLGETEAVRYDINENADIIFCDGVNTPKRWNNSAPTLSSDLGLTAPADNVITPDISSAEESGHRGIQKNGTYWYKVSYIYQSSTTTKHGSSNGVACGQVDITGATSTKPRQITIAFPVSAENNGYDDVDRINIYRSPADIEEGPYRYLGYITPGDSDGFLDTIPVGEEGIALPADTPSPLVPILIHPTVMGGRLWGFSASVKGKLVYSDPGEPDNFPVLSYFYVNGDGKGIIEFNKNMYVFTNEHVYILPGGDPSGDLVKICDRGCSSHQSIQDVGNGICWQGTDNIYWSDFNIRAVDGDYPIPIGEPIKDQIQRIATTRRDNSRSVFYKNKYFLCFTDKGSTVNSKTLVWNVEVGIPLLRKGFYGGWSSVDWSGNDVSVLNDTLYHADNTGKYIYQHDVVGVDDITDKVPTTASIKASLATKTFHFGHEISEKILRSISLIGESSGTTWAGTVLVDNASYSRSFSLDFGSAIALATEFSRYDDPLSIYDNTNTEGDYSYYAGSLYNFRNKHKKFKTGLKGINFKISLTSNDIQDTKLIALILYYKYKLPPL